MAEEKEKLNVKNLIEPILRTLSGICILIAVILVFLGLNACEKQTVEGKATVWINCHQSVSLFTWKAGTPFGAQVFVAFSGMLLAFLYFFSAVYRIYRCFYRKRKPAEGIADGVILLVGIILCIMSGSIEFWLAVGLQYYIGSLIGAGVLFLIVVVLSCIELALVVIYLLRHRKEGKNKREHAERSGEQNGERDPVPVPHYPDPDPDYPEPYHT